MHTLLLQNKPRAGSSGNTWSIEVIGQDSAVRTAVKEAIRSLEHHPAKAARRSLIDMLTLIENFNFEIKYTEHFYTDDNLEGWSFILQG
ncbi:MAG TPA: hypothetical protein EYP41_21060 [Anaerolineae bacterium]|nr:hypothetical protein [Chloroflexota bacterium]HID54516.1 hypothetical protein [Anaerolineae bacterium]HIP73792.1 hypothetical protein [Anaerolineae bacterium]